MSQRVEPLPLRILNTGLGFVQVASAIKKFLCTGWEVVRMSRRKPELPGGLWRQMTSR
jgi:hypothetical protein